MFLSEKTKIFYAALSLVVILFFVFFFIFIFCIIRWRSYLILYSFSFLSLYILKFGFFLYICSLFYFFHSCISFSLILLFFFLFHLSDFVYGIFFSSIFFIPYYLYSTRDFHSFIRSIIFFWNRPVTFSSFFFLSFASFHCLFVLLIFTSILLFCFHFIFSTPFFLTYALLPFAAPLFSIVFFFCLPSTEILSPSFIHSFIHFGYRFILACKSKESESNS